MRLEHSDLLVDEIRGDLVADYLIAIEADFRIVDGEEVIYEESSFPVAELAHQLAGWLTGDTPGDFLFDSMSFEDPGAVTISSEHGGWVVSSSFTPSVRSAPVDWSSMEDCVGQFVRSVSSDLQRCGFDAEAIIEPSSPDIDAVRG